MNPRLTLTLALAVVLSLLVATTAFAHNSSFVEDGGYDNAKATHGHDQHQHGGTEGHIDVDNYNVDLVSKLALRNVVEGKIADVGVLGDYAYLAAWGGQTCKYNGVHVVDISDVANPDEVAFIQSKEGSYPGEGVQALPISTSAFNGDILVTNNEQCNETAGVGGMNIYDVTDAEHPVPLAVGYGDDATAAGATNKAAHQIHSVFAWDAGDRAFAVMVDNEEAADVDIVDITNPRRPALIAEYDLAKLAPTILQPGQDLDEVFLHDMIVKKIGTRFVMLASYWDAGYVQLDVTNPKNATYISDSDFPNPDTEGLESELTTPDGTPVAPEGNGHQAEFTGDNAYVLAADEDFSPYALTANTDDGSEIAAGQGSDTPTLPEGSTLGGQAVFFGRGCPGDPMASQGDGSQIAVVERGLCTFTEKVASVEAVGGYAAVLIFNRTGSDGCDGSLGMSVEGNIPAFGVAPRGQGFGIFDKPYSNADCLAGTGSSVLSPVAVGTTGDTLSFSSYFDGWGYVRLLNGKSMAQLDTYAIPEAHDQTYADGFGDLSVHEVAASRVRSDLSYVSYYSGGIRVVDVAAGRRKGSASITEVGAFIDEGGNNFWGVEVFRSGGKEYVAASDRDFGLYIFEYTGP